MRASNRTKLCFRSADGTSLYRMEFGDDLIIYSALSICCAIYRVYARIYSVSFLSRLPRNISLNSFYRIEKCIFNLILLAKIKFGCLHLGSRSTLIFHFDLIGSDLILDSKVGCTHGCMVWVGKCILYSLLWIDSGVERIYCNFICFISINTKS